MRARLAAALILAFVALVVRSDAQGPAYTFVDLTSSSPQSGGLAYSQGSVFVASDTSVLRFAPSGAATLAVPMIERVRAVTADDQGNAYVVSGCGVLRVLPRGFAQMVAGTSALARSSGCGAVDAPRGRTDIWNQTARFLDPEGIARNAAGTIFVADTGNSTIRMITSDLTVTTILGAAGVIGSTDGPGTASRFNAPTALALDSTGNLFVADTGNHTIRKVTTLGDVTTFAGTAGSSGTADGVGAAARFNGPRGLSFGPDGSLFVADTGNSRIRVISPSGQVTTLSGATFNAPRGIAVDTSGALYVADSGNEVVRVGVAGTAAAPSITAQPLDATAATQGTGTFSVTAAGTPSPGYRWQVSTDAGGTWTGLSDDPYYSGVFSDTLRVLSPERSASGRRFRVIVGNLAGSVTSAPAALSVAAVSLAPSRLDFAAVKRPGTSFNEIQSSEQTVTVNWNGGAAPWRVTVDRPWLFASPETGNGSGSFSVQVVQGGPGAGAATTGTVTFSSAEAGLTYTVPVGFTVYTTDSAPIGVFDTPANNATGLSGSVALTGWALDDITVDRVEIWRDPLPGEALPPNGAPGDRAGKIFVGFATFVPGARPDVQAVFPNAPAVYSAGWGYMLLTYGLPNQGNGTFKFSAYGVDRAISGANAGLLGTKTITIDNVNAARPFGAIDTPGPGTTVSAVTQNFGWALTPGPLCSISNPNVKVSIDSGPLQPVVYGDARSDVAGAFPGYTNAAAAGGHFTLDTTTLTNGLHTIGWLVTDSCGRADGMGSRFFTVANSANAASTSLSPASLSFSENRPDSRSFSDGWMWLARMDGSYETPMTAPDGTRIVRVDQGERIALQLPGPERYAASQIVDGARRDLPVGSSFDASAGRFYWQPAAGFLGAYDLEFSTGQRSERVRVVVGPVR